MDLQDLISTNTFAFFSDRRLKATHLPITTQCVSSPMGLGSDSLPVSMTCFGVNSFLADSMQFLLEYACRLTKIGCYYILPSFRGESPDESHLCEFYHSEAEIRGSLGDVLKLVEDYIRYLSLNILDVARGEIEDLVGDISHIDQACESHSWSRISFEDAVSLIQTTDLNVRHSSNGMARSITRRGEQSLLQYFHGPVWIIEPDHLSVPFYQAFADHNRKTAKAADLLAGIGELVGAGQRHCSCEDLEAALRIHGIEEHSYAWYIELKRLYPMLTSGFGLGIERYLCWILKHNDIRDCQFIPRVNGQAMSP